MLKNIIAKYIYGDLEVHVGGKLGRGCYTRTRCSSFYFIQFKVLHRLHLFKIKLTRMFPSMEPACNCCKLSPVSLAHSFWHCPSFKLTIRRDPLIAIFGVAGESNSNLFGTELKMAKLLFSIPPIWLTNFSSCNCLFVLFFA